jgi:hypothetical protein
MMAPGTTRQSNVDTLQPGELLRTIDEQNERVSCGNPLVSAGCAPVLKRLSELSMELHTPFCMKLIFQ